MSILIKGTQSNKVLLYIMKNLDFLSTVKNFEKSSDRLKSFTEVPKFMLTRGHIWCQWLHIERHGICQGVNGSTL